METKKLEEFDFKALQEKAMVEIKKWPLLLKKIVLSPAVETAALPTEGDWQIPAIYAATAGVALGFVHAFGFYRFSLGGILTAFLSGIVMTTLSTFVGGAVLNFILSMFGKDPSIYRTIYLSSIMSGLMALTAVVDLVFPFVSILCCILPMYVLYNYAQTCAGFSKKQAKVGMVIMISVSLIPLLIGALALVVLVHR